MTAVIAVRSFRRGTGKSVIAANLAAQLATEGSRVGIAEVGFENPGLHYIFGFPEEGRIKPTINDFLLHRCTFDEVFFDVGANMPGGAPELIALHDKPIWLAPAQPTWRAEMMIDLKHNHFPSLYRELTRMSEKLRLDYLFLDMNGGYMDDNVLYALALSDLVLVVMQPDKQDYQGTATLLTLLEAIEIPNTALIMNQIPVGYDLAEVKQHLRNTFDVDSITLLPLIVHDSLMGVAGNCLFSLRAPEHAWSQQLHELTLNLPELTIHREPVSTYAPSISAKLRAQISGREPGAIRKVDHSHDAY